MGSFEENDHDIFVEPSSYGVHDLSPRIGPEYQAEISFVIKKSEQLRMNPADSESVHDKSRSFEIGFPISVTWSDADTKSFLLGLFIFRKNFVQIKRFLDNKGMGEILSFYYGKFYKSDVYRRWSECRKINGRNCIIGQRLFTGPRQHKLLSRLICRVCTESQDALLQVSKSYVEGVTSLEEYISSLKSMVGIGVLVEAVGIGNEKGDLTRLGVEHGKNSRASSDPTSKALTSLGPSDIIQSLTGGYRLSKTKSTELFWEAVWPRLQAKRLKFSRRKLVKGDHYFDSVSDALSKVVAEPNILGLEEEDEAKVGSLNEEEPGKGSNEVDLSDDHRQCYLKPRSSPYKKDYTKFMVIDTSLVRGGMPSDPMELKSVPINSVCKLEVYADGNRFKGKIYTRKVSHSTDMSKSIEQNSTKLTLTDTNRLSEGKLLKVKAKMPDEFDDASTMATGLFRDSKGGSSTDDLPRMVEAKMLICGENKINETDSCTGVSNSSATSKKEAYDNNPDNDANKMVESQKSQHAYEFDDNRLKRIIKHQFNRRVRSSDSNLSAIPIKRRRLTACAKAEKSRIIENSSGGLGSDKLGFSRSSSFPDANKNVYDPTSHQQNGSSTAFSANKIVEEIAAVFNSPIMSHNSGMVSKVLISPTMNMAAASVLVPPSKPSSSTLPNIPTHIGSIDSINQQGEPKDKAAATQKDVSRLEKNQRKMRKDIKKLLAVQEIIQKLLLRVLENQANVFSAVPPVEDQPLPKPSTSFSLPSNSTKQNLVALFVPRKFISFNNKTNQDGTL
ncbi:unnamed protein product [Trifolium pratense]|uniref:Uncharacterized protein n=1 Tax=Trifolium pratense TaxID=57577 RepID=A0ACB0II07_TRIPR|nr:unnamed protein product [Trifolium pratense]